MKSQHQNWNLAMKNSVLLICIRPSKTMECCMGLWQYLDMSVGNVSQNEWRQEAVQLESKSKHHLLTSVHWPIGSYEKKSQPWVLAGPCFYRGQHWISGLEFLACMTSAQPEHSQENALHPYQVHSCLLPGLQYHSPDFVSARKLIYHV